MTPPIQDDSAWGTAQRNVRVHETGLVHLSTYPYRLYCVPGLDGLVSPGNAEETDDPVNCIGCQVKSGFEC